MQEGISCQCSLAVHMTQGGWVEVSPLNVSTLGEGIDTARECSGFNLYYTKGRDEREACGFRASFRYATD